MKAYKVISIITIILLITIISLASFLGIYKLKGYKVVNVVPKYLLGMEFSDSRIVNFTVDDGIKSTVIYDKDGNEIKEKEEGVEYTEENGYTTVKNKINPDDILTKENYTKVKNILKRRLINLGADQYKIRLDNETGNIQIQMMENDDTDRIISNLSEKGTFELTDDETGEILIGTDCVDDVNVVYGQSDIETTVYLQIKFNKEGQAKLKEISQKYVSNIPQNPNDEEKKDVDKEKKVAIVFNGETYRTTYFGETIEDGRLNIAIGQANNTESLHQFVNTANDLSIILGHGMLPITYNTTNYILNSDITKTQINVFYYVAISILAIMVIYLVIKLKMKGLLAGILYIGYIALLLLVLRYTNIKITLEGIVGIVISVIINYIYLYKSFENVEVSFIKDTTLKISLKLIPIYIIAIVFTFNTIANISSLGMTLVWGILMMYVYNLTLTQMTIKTVKGDK